MDSQNYDESDSDSDEDSNNESEDDSDEDDDKSDDEGSVTDNSQVKGGQLSKNLQTNSTGSSLENRVFVCIGKYGKANEIDRKQAVWVMTLDEKFENVKFWDCVQHKETVLKGRIRYEEVEKLKAYLTCEDLTAREEKLRDKIEDWINQTDENEEESKSEDDEESSK